MNPKIVPFHRNEPLVDDGMLFVRTEGIVNTMLRMPLILAGLIVMTIGMPLQTSFSSTRTLELTMYSDGSTHITTQLEVDTFSPDFQIELFGPSIDNFVAVGEDGFLLSSEVIEDKAIIDTFGSSSITIDYDIHDLISKEGRVWTFSFDSPSDYTLLMPPSSIIVGMSTIPKNMEILEEQTKLELSSGPTEINYILGTATIPVENQPLETSTPEEDYTVPIVIGIIAAGGITGASVFIKKTQAKTSIRKEIVPDNIPDKSVDTQKIFDYRPDMREDDKKIVKFLSENGGKAFESDLRKKFLQPRTTMWRAVKRLERLGVIEITKKDLQNLVTLRDDLEMEE